MKKAYHVARIRHETKILAKHSQSGASSSVSSFKHGKNHDFAGGIPLKLDGKVVGAFGVSGGSGDQDHAVAAAGAARSDPAERTATLQRKEDYSNVGITTLAPTSASLKGTPD